MQALYYLRQSFKIDPQDPQTVYGLAFTNIELEDIEHVQKHFQKVQEMEAPKYLRGLARNRLREIAFEIGMLGKYGLDINDTQVGPRPAVAAVDGAGHRSDAGEQDGGKEV